MPTLQIELSQEQMDELRGYAREQGRTMKSMVLGWFAAAKTGTIGEPVVGSGFPMVEVGEELLAKQLELMAAQVQAQAAQTKALEAQTALLERLVQQERQATPGGGTGPLPVVVTASEGVEPISRSFAFTGFEDYSSTNPAPGGEERRGATDGDLVVGAAVWIKPWGCWGEVLEEPAGEHGPAYVKAVEGGSRMPGHFAAGQLEVLSPFVHREDGDVT